MIFGERGVWRPGDSVFLNFILDDRSKRLPEGYPITMELFNARGQLQETNDGQQRWRHLSAAFCHLRRCANRKLEG